MSLDRNLMMVRIADPTREPVKQWCEMNSTRNAFDEQVLTYPTTRVLAAHSNGTTHAYLPIQGLAVLESIGLNPSSSQLELATGVMECVKASVVLAQSASYKEMMFLASDDVTAEGATRMGFEELPYKVFRKRI